MEVYKMEKFLLFYAAKQSCSNKEFNRLESMKERLWVEIVFWFLNFQTKIPGEKYIIYEGLLWRVMNHDFLIVPYGYEVAGPTDIIEHDIKLNDEHILHGTWIIYY